MTDVFNLTDDRVATYSLPPDCAVQLAQRQLTDGDYCWWNKPVKPLPPLVRSENAVYCGDWGAMKRPEDRRWWPNTADGLKLEKQDEKLVQAQD